MNVIRWNQFYTLKTVLFKAIQTLFYKNHRFINAIKHKLHSTFFLMNLISSYIQVKSMYTIFFSYFYSFLLFEVILLSDTKYRYLYSAMIQTLILITLWKSNLFHHCHWSKRKLLQIKLDQYFLNLRSLATHRVKNFKFFFF